MRGNWRARGWLSVICDLAEAHRSEDLQTQLEPWSTLVSWLTSAAGAWRPSNVIGVIGAKSTLISQTQARSNPSFGVQRRCGGRIA